MTNTARLKMVFIQVEPSPEKWSQNCDGVTKLLRGYWDSIYQELQMFMTEELVEVGLKAGP